MQKTSVIVEKFLRFVCFHLDFSENILYDS